MPSRWTRSHCESLGFFSRLPGRLSRVSATVFMALFLSRAQHRSHHSVMGSAAAQVAVERRAHFGFGRPGIVRQERRSADQDAAGAIAALGRLLGEEGFLEWMSTGRAQSFYGRNALAGRGPQRGVASGNRMAIDQYE